MDGQPIPLRRCRPDRCILRSVQEYYMVQNESWLVRSLLVAS